MSFPNKLKFIHYAWYIFPNLYPDCFFAVKGRENIIANKWKTELHKYISGIIKGKDQKPFIVNGMPDHIHAFIGLRPAMPIADIVRGIKNIMQCYS